MLRYLPAYLLLVMRCAPLYVVAIAALRGLRAVAPIAVLLVAKAIIALVETRMGMPTSVVTARLLFLVAIECALVIGTEALQRLSSLLEARFADIVDTTLTLRVIQHATALDLAQFEEPTTYDMLQHARDHSSARASHLLAVFSILQYTITVTTLAVALFAYLPWLLLFLIVAITPTFFGETHFGGIHYALRSAWIPERRRMDYLRHLVAYDRTIPEVKLLGAAPYLIDRYSLAAWEYCSARKALLGRQAFVSTGLMAIGALAFYSGYGILAYLTVTGFVGPRGPFTLAVFTFLAAAFRQCRELFQQGVMSIANIFEQSLSARDLLRLLAVRPQVISPPQARRVPYPLQRGVEFEDVGFRYPGATAWTLRHLTFAITPGESLALVGRNGAGKSTIVKLLGRLYDVQEGRILLDGVDLREYDIDDLRHHIAVVLQDFLRFDFRFGENIGIGRVNSIADSTRIHSAARSGLADTVAARLPHGFEQQLGRTVSGGVDLSGGEWQKIAMARAYMREAQLLVLDEPTASLDARSEHAVFHRVARLARQKTALIISHRFSTVRVADRIVVLQDGRVAEQGTHHQLMARSGEYAELFSLQAAGYR